MKDKSRLIKLAKFSLVTGAIGFIFVIAFYFKYGSLFALVEERHPDIHRFLFAFKVTLLGLCPGACLIIIGLSLEVLSYFKKERERNGER